MQCQYTVGVSHLVAVGRWDEAVEAARRGRAVALVVLHEGEVEPEPELVVESPVQARDQLRVPRVTHLNATHNHNIRTATWGQQSGDGPSVRHDRSRKHGGASRAHRNGGEDEVGRERSRRRPGPEPEPAEGQPRVDGGSEGGTVEEAEERQRDDGRREEGRQRAPAQRAAPAPASPALLRLLRRRRLHRPPTPRAAACVLPLLLAGRRRHE